MGHQPVIVLDNGGSSCKIGLAGQSEPYRHENAARTCVKPSCISLSCQQRSYRDTYKHMLACRVFPNAIGRAKGERQSFVGDQLLSYRDASSLVLRRPFDRSGPVNTCLHSTTFMPVSPLSKPPDYCRGYLVNWDVEKAVWWRAFKSLLQVQPQDCSLLMTEPPFNLPSIQSSTLQVSPLSA